MNIYQPYIITGIIFYIFSYLYYLKFSNGLGNKATFLQMRRFIFCTVLAILPAALAQMPLTSPAFTIPTFIAFLWVVAYPTIYWYDNHKVSSDFEFHFEAVFGMCTVGWISSLVIVSSQIPFLSYLVIPFITIAELVFLFIPLSLFVYFALYKSCINEAGMQLLQDTDHNEIIEFFSSLPLVYNAFSLLAVITSIYTFTSYNLTLLNVRYPLSTVTLSLISALAIFLTIYIWKKRHGVFRRTAIIEFYLDVKKYRQENMRYTESAKERLLFLDISRLGKVPKGPHTFILVIGESASRDYMQAFNTEYKYETTPWLSKQKSSENFTLFPNSFSCDDYTVGALSMALTEYNQYEGGSFYKSCSIVDMAHKLGYKVHWYSNQGHLGSADTPVTLLAETSDVAKWTKQKLNQNQYDESLLEYLDEVNPENNNFIVIHLMGSHFNFINRYPKSFTRFGTLGKYDLEVNYANSIAYTDSVLEKIFNYSTKRLNLQAMVYCSDHATIPDKRRSPNFDGFEVTRIPLFVYTSDEYALNNPNIVQGLKANSLKYWTNDLLYDLIASLFNIQSTTTKEANSIASLKYAYDASNIKILNMPYK